MSFGNSPPTWLVVVVALAYEATLIIAWLLDSSPLGRVRLPRITALPFVLVLGLTGHTTSCVVAVVVFGVASCLKQLSWEGCRRAPWLTCCPANAVPSMR